MAKLEHDFVNNYVFDISIDKTYEIHRRTREHKQQNLWHRKNVHYFASSRNTPNYNIGMRLENSDSAHAPVVLLIWVFFPLTKIAGNFPEIADLLLPKRGPLERDNLENLRRKDENYFKTRGQKRENENDRDNSNSANVKVQAPGLATSRS